eukprot:s967_g14.t2
MVQRSPPPPMGLPTGQATTFVCDPPPPTTLPGVKSNKGLAATPPPPTDFPSAQGELPCLLTAPPPPSMPFWLACLLALLAGASVTLQVGAGIVLNDTPAPKLAHAAYVTVGNMVAGGLWLLILSILQGGPAPAKPKYLWSAFGGLVVLPGFVATPAAALLGTQMSSAFLFDWSGNRLQITRYVVLGILLLLGAICMQLLSSIPDLHGSDLKLLGYAVAALLVGVCYTLQAKMNNRLARDLGSTARAAAFCNLTAMTWGLPMCLALVDFGVPLDFAMGDWWIWLFLGLQSAFYTYALAELPKVLGYSVSCILVITGKMCTAALADTIGLFAKPLAISPWRCISVAATLLGAVSLTFSRARAPAEVQRPREDLSTSCEDLHASKIAAQVKAVAFPGAPLQFSPPPPEKLPGDVDKESEDGSESGEDSDLSIEANYERHRTDLDTLIAQHSSVIRATTRQRSCEDAEDLPKSAHELARLQRRQDSMDSKEKPSFLNRIFQYGAGRVEEEGGPRESILHQDISGLDDVWLRRWTHVLEKDGITCTKIATNGKPYERRIHVDSRNMMVEVHQGRNGTVGISLDDLVDLCKDLQSLEFSKFRRRKTSAPADLSRRALILHTPARSFSFLFNNASQRDVLGHFLLYLLKSRGRGVMANMCSSNHEEDETPATSAPPDGFGKVLYPNNSCYEGAFFRHMRHGHGTLYLPERSMEEMDQVLERNLSNDRSILEQA